MSSDIIARQSTLHNRLYLENRIYFKNERSRVRNPHSWGARRDEGVYSFLSLFQGFSSVSPLDLPWRRRMPIPHLLSVLQRLCEDPSLWSPFLTSWHQPYVVPRASSWCPYPVLSPLLTPSRSDGHWNGANIWEDMLSHRGWYCNSKKRSSYTWSTAIHTLNNLGCCAANISWWGEKGNVKWVFWRRLITGMGRDSVEIKLEIYLVQE